MGPPLEVECLMRSNSRIIIEDLGKIKIRLKFKDFQSQICAFGPKFAT